MSVVVLGLSSLHKRLNAIGGPAANRRMLTMLGTAAVAEQKLLVHRKTGNTARSIHVSETTDTRVTITAGGAAEFLEYGTAPHEITPNAKKALAWAASPAGRRLSGNPTKAAQRGQSGGMAFAKRVHHPGTKPYPFMVPGAEAAIAKADLAAQVIRDWNEAA